KRPLAELASLLVRFDFARPASQTTGRDRRTLPLSPAPCTALGVPHCPECFSRLTQFRQGCPFFPFPPKLAAATMGTECGELVWRPVWGRAMADYLPAVAKLLTRGAPSSDHWPDPRVLGLEPEHVPDLIRLAADPVRYRDEDEGPEIWGPLH